MISAETQKRLARDIAWYRTGDVTPGELLHQVWELILTDNVDEVVGALPREVQDEFGHWASRAPESVNELLDPIPSAKFDAIKHWYRNWLLQGNVAPKRHDDPWAPRQILEASSSKLRVEGFGWGRAFKLWPGSGRRIEESECAPSDLRRIKLCDVEELLEHGSEIIVLSTGSKGEIQVAPEALVALSKKSVPVHVAETSQAVELYNRLANEKARVGGIFY